MLLHWTKREGKKGNLTDTINREKWCKFASKHDYKDTIYEHRTREDVKRVIFRYTLFFFVKR